MSNLSTAKSLIQADLAHARNVLNLWTNQVSELEQTLLQIEAVGTSRSALHVDYHYSAMSFQLMQVYRGAAIRTPTANDGTQRGDKGAAYCR